MDWMIIYFSLRWGVLVYFSVIMIGVFFYFYKFLIWMKKCLIILIMDYNRMWSGRREGRGEKNRVSFWRVM